MKTTLLYIMLLACSLVHAQDVVHYCDSLIGVGKEKTNRRKYHEAIEIMLRAQQIAEKNNLPKQFINATNIIGVCYAEMLDYGTALKYHLEAYNASVKIKDTELEMAALNDIAILYGQEEQYDKAFEYFNKAYNISRESKNDESTAVYLLNLALVKNKLGDIKESVSYLEKALPMAKKYPATYTLVQIAFAEDEMMLHHTAASLKMANDLLNSMPNEKGNNDVVTLHMIISKNYLYLQNFAVAEKYANLALQCNTDLSVRLSIFELLSEIAQKKGSYAQAIAFKDSIFSIQNRLNNIKNGRIFENNRVKFELQDYRNQIAIKEATITQERRLFYALAGCLTAGLLLVFFILRNRSMRHKQRELEAENSNQQLQLQLARSESDALLAEQHHREEQHRILLEQEQLKNEIEYKNRKLSSQALHTSGKYQMIEDVIKLLSGEPELVRIPAIKKHIRFLRDSLRNDNEWDNFLVHFEEVNQGFLSRLKAAHPDLNANDIRFICYVYMNLNAKEISVMLNISPDATRKRKERIAQKLGLPDSTSLYSYLSAV
ncbi:transcriptional regulator [Flavobacterium sp. RHBU_3]|uniref:transcriptional regulator n=1 Tax=Flavobacterium sp. RHBU_3 TaxID=3391184 RepID=UPI003984FCAC